VGGRPWNICPADTVGMYCDLELHSLRFAEEDAKNSLRVKDQKDDDAGDYAISVGMP
jgi:hypothetical protein